MSATIYETIIQNAQDMALQLQEIRRDFHTYAESGWFEIRTSSIIASRLTELGYEVLTGREVCMDKSRMGLPSQEEMDEQYERALKQGAVQPYAGYAKGGFTGVIGILDCGEGPVIAMRFDIDALGVIEEKNVNHRPSLEGFCSVNDGMMHACGHDGHAAIGLGVAGLLASLREKLHGKIKLIFQPAEEGVRGAKAIVDHGHLDDVDFVLGNHIANDTGEEYQVGLSAGSTFATSKLDIYFAGKASHAGSAPENGNNAMLSAATAVLNLQAIPRNSKGDTRINVGVMQAGTGRNVICDRARLQLEVRGATTEANQYMESYARKIVKSAAELHGCSSEVKLMGAAESFKSDMELNSRCERVCREMLELKATPPRAKSGASEDYAYMVNRVRSHGGQGLFFNTLTHCSGPNHSEIFDFQEDCLVNGVKVFCGMVCDLMNL